MDRYFTYPGDVVRHKTLGPIFVRSSESYNWFNYSEIIDGIVQDEIKECQTGHRELLPIKHKKIIHVKFDG